MLKLWSVFWQTSFSNYKIFCMREKFNFVNCLYYCARNSGNICKDQIQIPSPFFKKYKKIFLFFACIQKTSSRNRILWKFLWFLPHSRHHTIFLSLKVWSGSFKTKISYSYARKPVPKIFSFFFHERCQNILENGFGKW